jgi:predicted nucleic acid-binding protein
MIILDTNAYSQLQKGDVLVKKEILSSSRTLLSVISLGELYRGFKIGSKEIINNKLLENFIKGKNIKTIDISKKTSKIYGEISSLLRKQGTPLPMNDVWIAASAIETNSTLITYDKHFLNIPNLKLWSKISK